jgi:hypothetical protein
MKRRAAIISLALVLLVGLGVVLCQAPLQQWRSMASLRKVDDYPLYVMRYYGDYGFARFLQRGIGRERAEAPPIELAPGWACTGFAAMNPTGDAITGRNFDWHNRQTLLLFTNPPDGYASVSMVDVSYFGFPADDPTWADRRLLLQTPYLPFDGMNERGLAVSIMAVPRAQDSQKPGVTISSMHAIRLMLDFAADVEGAISLLGDYTIDFGEPPIHYFVADASGHSAVIEYLDGKVDVVRNDEMWQVSTNFLLAETRPEGADSPCWRYNRAYERLEQAEGTLSSAEAMSLLEDVAQENTMWSVTYNVTRGAIQVVMGRQYDHVHSFRLRMQN